MKTPNNCEYCVYYDYDEMEEAYICSMDLDQDEMGRFLAFATEGCPYFRFSDEYALARKQ